MHFIIIIPPKYSFSRIIRKSKANTSRELSDGIEEVKKIYRGKEFWSPGFFSSPGGINEETTKRYVEFQEKLDKGQVQLSQIQSATGVSPWVSTWTGYTYCAYEKAQ